MSSRLFRSIIVFGAAMGAGAGVVTVASGCDLHFCHPTPEPGPHGIIDASTYGTIADAPERIDAYGIIDASVERDAGPPHDAYGIIDAGSGA